MLWYEQLLLVSQEGAADSLQVLWSVGVGWSVQRRYSELGGTETTTHEAQEAAAAAAYANREQLASAAYRASLYNKEQPDPITQAAWEVRITS